MLPFKVSALQREQMGSPSISLEKGSYRMRRPTGATYEPHNPSRIPKRRPTPTMSSTLTTFLPFILAFACLTCFGFAYYLYSTRWAAPTTSPRTTHTDHDALITDESLQAIRFDLHADVHALRERNNSSEKFLAYLPHSGFHNQRIAFENALVLAHLLNRTLLAPPVRLGTPLPYFKFDRLKRLLALSGKDGLFHCGTPLGRRFRPQECFDYFDYTFVPWDWLVDLTPVRQQQHIVQCWNMTDEWLEDTLRIEKQVDVYTLKDAWAYHYRFVDHPYDVPPNLRYKTRMPIDDLARVPERVLQLGSLFGSSRLHLKNPRNFRLRTMIRRSMVPNVPGLEDTADSIKRTLGGSYLGAHVRLGDGQFAVQGQNSTMSIWKQLVAQIFVLDADVLEKAMVPQHNSQWIDLLKPAADYANLETQPPLNLSCRRPKHRSPSLAPLNIPLFISTDAKDPQRHPFFEIFLHTFPCTFFLSDFSPKLESLHRRNDFDGVPLRDHLVPFLNAMIIGKAWKAVGTEGSTFSAFITDVLWRHYHGLEIHQRG
ncbi:hypothetical protein HGRIS_002365 [Hohenbuehelia grisea]|uniref:Uncharacterized protein n=1 Tax=Hohenbuehelia grisea TaxID=104357 RepID=A0ABR3JKB1_9AGAR